MMLVRRSSDIRRNELSTQPIACHIHHERLEAKIIDVMETVDGADEVRPKYSVRQPYMRRSYG